MARIGTKVVTFLEEEVIGVLYVEPKGKAYLNYVYKNKTDKVEEPNIEIIDILEKVTVYCGKNNFNLIMY